jgi:hypothetical protein
MARALPVDFQTVQGSTDTLTRDLKVVYFVEVLLEQRCSPDGRALIPIARVRIDDFVQQRVDDSVGGSRPAAAWPIVESGAEVEVAAAAKAVGPVVESLAADAQALGNVARAVALGQPQESLGAAKDAGLSRGGDQFL